MHSYLENDSLRDPPGGRAASERDLMAVIEKFARELHPQRTTESYGITLASRIERDLGIDSLARTELILRIERAFRLRLPAELLGEAETVGDLLEALERAPAVELSGRDESLKAPSLPVVPAAVEARTLIEVLDWHVDRHSDRLHLTLLQDDNTIAGALTYGQLATEARRVAAGLIARDILPGDRVALMLPTSVEFFIAFFGILYAGAAPVPIYPPMRLAQLEDHLRRQAGILRNAGARILVIMPEGLRLAALLRAQVGSLTSVESVAGLTSGASDLTMPAVQGDRATALIQYTSGSTGDPKGVVLNHANLLANVRAMGQAMNASSADKFVSWLPLYHDMGLIGAWLGCLHFAAPLYVMSPLGFLVRPESWLWAISRFRATLSAAPNFGFELCINKIDVSRLDGLDLGSLRMVANGAEPISAKTLRRFAEKFEPFGFKREAMAPVYGLAENSVGLAFPPPGRPPLIDYVDRNSLMSRGIAEPAKSGDPNPLELVACGQPLPGHEIRIVDEIGHEVGERREGRLEFRGPSATAGYFNNEAKTRELIHDGWLDSGDRAYIAGGDVFITGRIKDIIIRAGRHLYPQEVEEAIGFIPGMRKGCVAVFGVADPRSGTERVVVVAETAEANASIRAALEAKAQEIASDISGTPADEIVLAPPRTVPKTSSGKIRRSAAKELYEQGRIGAPRRALWLQIVRLAFAGIHDQSRRLVGLLSDVLYAAWWWIAVATGYFVAWVAVMTLPRLDQRWALVRRIARIMLAALRAPISVAGVEKIPPHGAILVFNHSSYSDVVALAAILPAEPVFVAKRELARHIFVGPFLRRLGVLFVERFDVAGSLVDAKALIDAARQGRNLVFFPEGTFTRRAGLSAFYLGAFKIAAEADLPILPGILRGTRSMLRGDQWFPRRVALSVRIENAVKPTGTDFTSVIKLRDDVRKAILTHCGEPDINELAKPPAPSAAT
jgi:1-acyl-sn-glycerol-3-phosphate acyltransferase